MEDTVGSENKTDKSDAKSSYVLRSKMIENSKTIEFKIPLHIDFLQCPKYLIPGLNISLKLLRQYDDFVLLGPSKTRNIVTTGGVTKTYTYKIKIKSLKLSLRYLTLSQEITEKHAALLKAGRPALYHFPFSRVNNHVINPNIKFVPLQQVASGILPNLIIFGIVPAANVVPNIKKNPYYFNHHNLKQVVFKVNGQIVSDYTLDYTDNKVKALAPYLDLHEILCLNDQSNSISLSFEQYKSGMNFYAYDLVSGHACNSFHFHKPLIGSLDIDLFFDPAPTEALQLIEYKVYNRTLSIDENRNVKFAN